MSTPSRSKQSPGTQAETSTSDITGTMAATHLPPVSPSFHPPPTPYQSYSQSYSHEQGRSSQGSSHSSHPANTMSSSSSYGQHMMAQQAIPIAHPPTSRDSNAMSFDMLLHPTSAPTLRTSMSTRDRMQISRDTILSPDTTQGPHLISSQPSQQSRSIYPYDPARSHSPSETLIRTKQPAVATSRRNAPPMAGFSSGVDPHRYRLTIRQQPEAARACGHGERDRRVVDPPPILSLSLDGFDPNSEEDVSALKQPLNIVQCLLYSVPDGQDVTTTPDVNNPGKTTRRLMGTLVANPLVGFDPEIPGTTSENSRIGVFFIFHDLSCRSSGKYSLHFRLSFLGPAFVSLGAEVPILATADSNVFEVVAAKEFRGMKASSKLAVELKKQGATINIKKGAEAMAAAKRSKKRNSGSERSVSEDSK